jgi:hypothetical protein
VLIQTSWEVKLESAGADEALGMNRVGGVENHLPVAANGRRQAVVNQWRESSCGSRSGDGRGYTRGRIATVS